MDSEEKAWAWLQRMVEGLCDEAPEDLAYGADQMVDAYMAGHRAALGATPPETADERQAAIVVLLQDIACAKRHLGGIACKDELVSVQECIDAIESGEWRR